MKQIEKSIDVDVPVRTVYNQWTQFEEFPHFMKGVKEVRQLDAKRLHWRSEIAGKDVEWTAEITHQEPDRHIGWRSTSGATNAGSVKFEPVSASRTRVTLRLDYEPEGAVETTGSALGVVSARIEGDLKKFKEFIEQRGRETGAWRGEIHGGEVSGTVGSAMGGNVGSSQASDTISSAMGDAAGASGTGTRPSGSPRSEGQGRSAAGDAIRRGGPGGTGSTMP